jgi:hypothetical protein
MNSSRSTGESHISVNQDGQIVWHVCDVRTDSCLHTFDPVVLPRALSLAIAKAVIAAQEGGST